jgi:hypothetical protein
MLAIEQARRAASTCRHIDRDRRKPAGGMGNAVALVDVHYFGSPALFNPWPG